MNPFPEVFCKGGPSLRSRIVQMRYLGTLPAAEEGFGQKEVQTSPAATFDKGFGLAEPGKPAGTLQRPVIKIPSPALLCTGLLTKVMYQDRRPAHNTHRSHTSKPGPKAVSLKSRSPSPAVAKTAETTAKRYTRRPESTPIDRTNLRTTLHSSIIDDSLVKSTPRDALNLSLPEKLTAGLAPLRPFQRYSLGPSTLSSKMRMLLSNSSNFGHLLEDFERKSALNTALKDVFGLEDSISGRAAAYHHCESKEYYILLIGEMVPLSLCCRCAILAQFTSSYTGLLLCTGDHCPHRHLHSFTISENVGNLLWTKEESDMSKVISKALSKQIQTGSYRSRSLRTEARNRKEEPVIRGKFRDWGGVGQGSNRPYISVLTRNRGFRIRFRGNVNSYRRSSDSPVSRSIFPPNPLSTSILA